MNKIPWLDLLKYIVAGLGSVKTISKVTAKVIVKYILMWSGPQGFITSIILSRVVQYGLIELNDLRLEFRDHVTLKKFKKELPSGNTDKRKELENDILSGH